jgi:hypothetical protein
VFYGKPDRFHQAATGCGAVARVDIDVSAPEAFWTVVGVAISFDSGATVCTGEIFNVALESFVHCGSPEPIFRSYSLPVD